MSDLSKITLPDGSTYDLKDAVSRASASVFYGTCATAAATKDKVVTLSNTTGWSLTQGVIVGVKFSYSNTHSSSTANPVTLNVNGTGAKNIWYAATHSGSGNTGAQTTMYGYANRVIYYMYDGTYWVWLNAGWSLNANTVPAAQCETAAATAAKAASLTNHTLTANTYCHFNIRYSNTASSALTMNVDSSGAKPIYINGTASSSSNHTLPAGTYIAFYDGTNWYFRTDGKLPADISGDSATTNEHALGHDTDGNVVVAWDGGQIIDPEEETSPLTINKGGTGATTAAEARTNLGLGSAATYSVVSAIQDDHNLVTNGAIKRYIDSKTIPTENGSGSGDIIFFKTDSARSLNNLTLNLEPNQNLNGYNHPWAGGAGKNKYRYPYATTTKTQYGITWTDNGDGSITIDGTATSTAYFNFTVWDDDYVPLLHTAGAELTITGGTSDVRIFAQYREVGSTTSVTMGIDNGSGVTFTVPDAVDTYISYLRVNNGVTVNNVTIRPMIRLASETDATWEPYSNICPISGYDDVTVTRTGKNILPNIVQDVTKYGITMVRNADGSLTFNGTAEANLTFYLSTVGGTTPPTVELKPGTYTISGCPKGGSGSTYRIQFYRYRGGEFQDMSYYENGNDFTFTAVQGDGYRPFIRIANGYTCNNLTFKPQLEVGDTATEYEPYQSTTYPISLSSAGTIYGGTLDVTTGELVVDSGYVVIDNVSSFADRISTQNRVYVSTDTLLPASPYIYASIAEELSDGKTYCDRFPITNTGSNLVTPSITVGLYNYVYINGVTNIDSSITDKASLNTWITSNPIQLVYKLATPITYHLTPTEVTTLLGYNIIWMDAEGTIDLSYIKHFNDIGSSALCMTIGSNPEKEASCPGYKLLTNSYIQVIMANANTASGALTLNINGTGAKPIRINDAASSSTNKTLPAGSYFVFYDGSYYYFRTDGKLTGDITGNAATVNGHTVNKDVPSTAVFTDTTNLASMTGTLQIAQGGTGATTVAGVLNSLGVTELFSNHRIIKRCNKQSSITFTFSSYSTAALLFGLRNNSVYTFSIFCNGYLVNLGNDTDIVLSVSADYKTITVTNNSSNYIIIGMIQAGESTVT